MYRTDKQFMKNPATASSRIYVGNLPDNSKAEDLEGIFAQHGRILGLVVQKNFAFVQFENDEQAHAAIAMAHGFQFFGRSINVKQAIDTKKSSVLMGLPQHTNRNPTQFQPTNHQNMHTQQNPANAKQFNVQPLNTFNKMANLQAADDFHMNTNMSQPISHNSGPQPTKHPQMSPLPPPPYPMNKKNSLEPSRFIPPNAPRSGGADFRDEFRDEMYYDNYGPNTGSNKGIGLGLKNMAAGAETGYGSSSAIERPERNDCEIIVVSKGLTEYAEYIENRLKERDLIVDLLFPNNDVPIGRVLANISSRGCLYAILIMPQNEDHRSLTLNILHGVPEEHRNMPIEDAFLLISRNFSAYMRGEKVNTDAKEKLSATSRHPEHIQTLINLLAENRQLSLNQYDKIVTYLKEKRELQQKFDIDEGIDKGDKHAAEAKKQAELQNRIMNILNTKGDSQPVVEQREKTLKVKTEENPELLKDPSVQKALDSIMIGDMFKNIIAQT